MKELKKGNLVTDGDGAKGVVREVVHVPADGRGHPARDEVYVYWQLPFDSQDLHG